ncbi:MAG: 50S ribosomal protein L29 [Candidatus Saccharimonadaceae bacterium]|nr:50S ribosomal protein L29 [Candidatus Saccharimonadaceae bacterium]
MADKKKTSTKITKVSKKSVDIKSMTIEQLKTELVSKQNDLLSAKRGNRLGELTNPRVITETRKEIARIHTAIRAAEIAQFAEQRTTEKENK